MPNNLFFTKYKKEIKTIFERTEFIVPNSKATRVPYPGLTSNKVNIVTTVLRNPDMTGSAVAEIQRYSESLIFEM